MPGLLDEATVFAISEFQSYCNATLDLDLPMIDPLNPIIDADTLDALKYADESYANPYAVLASDGETEDYNEAEAYDEAEEYDAAEEYDEAEESADM